MPNASFVQTIFLGGEWSQYVQGRSDSNRYKTAMNVCLNSYPREEGGWTRRSGTKWLGPTKSGDVARIMSFDLAADEFYVVEFGNLYARYYLNGSPMYATPVAVSAFSGANPTVVTTGTNHGFSTGDHVIFISNGNDTNDLECMELFNRQFVVTVVDANEFTFVDAVTGGAINGADLTYSGTGITVAEITESVTTFDNDSVASMRVTQGEESLVILAGDVNPQVVTIVDGTPAVTTIVFEDGPYLDPVTDTTTLDPSGVSGSVTIVASNTTQINDGTGFQTTDVGRHIRLFWEPSAWSSGSAYTVGDVVTYEGQYYACVKDRSATAVTPAQDLQYWTLASASVSMWTWAKITARASTTSVTATIMGDPLPDHTARATWRLGLFSDTTGWPTVGTFHKGRLWLTGVQKNRLDGSRSNDPYNFAPTEKDGTVADDNAIAAVANAENRHKTVWMRSTDDGLMIGTEGGEWVGRASANDDPISPTNFDIKPISRYKAKNVESVMAGSSVLFVQRAGQKVMEFPLINEQGKVTATNIAVTFRHRLEPKLSEIIFQQEPAPMLWGRLADGNLVSCAYKREASEMYAGWSYHTPGGTGNTITSIALGPSIDGNSEALWMVAKDSSDNYSIQAATPPFEDVLEDWEAWFVDRGVTPSQGEIIEDGGVTYLRLYGLWPLEGLSVAAVIGGLDCGDFTVSGGYISIPLTGASAVLTTGFLQELTDAGVDYTDFDVDVVTVIP